MTILTEDEMILHIDKWIDRNVPDEFEYTILHSIKHIMSKQKEMSSKLDSIEQKLDELKK